MANLSHVPHLATRLTPLSVYGGYLTWFLLLGFYKGDALLMLY